MPDIRGIKNQQTHMKVVVVYVEKVTAGEEKDGFIT